jgi:hypothetical protein
MTRLPRRARRRLALPAAALALVAGCGSTVSTVTGSSASDTTGLTAPGSQLTGGGGAGSAPGTGTAGAGGSTGTTSGTGGTGAGATTAIGTGGPTGATPQLPVVSGQVVLKLGVVYLKGLDQAYKAANGGKSSTTDSQADYAAVIKELNARPGTKLSFRPSYYAVDASSTQPQADQLQAACAHFTQDMHVDIVVSYSAGTDAALAHCLQKRSVPLVDGFAGAELGASTLQQLPNLWAPTQLSLEQVGVLQPTYLVRHHWIDGRWGTDTRCAGVTQPRIGVITFDRADWRRAYNGAVAPTFKSLGHPVYDVDFLAVSGSTAEQVAQASSGAQNAVLKFSSECIDHVAFVGNVALDYLFMNVAQQQHYNPRYGLSSLEAPPVIVQNLAQPTPQLHGAIGPGWAPFSDVAIAQFDAAAKNPGAPCMSILTHAGIAPKDNNSSILALPSCEGPMFVAAVVDRWIAGGRSGTLLDVVNRLRSSYRAAGTYAVDMTASHHDGASSYRGFAYDDGCSCFRYTSGLQRV